ncbi:MAG: FAD-dependent oxidoreductase, partial [Pseudomonadota bacterium]
MKRRGFLGQVLSLGFLISPFSAWAKTSPKKLKSLSEKLQKISETVYFPGQGRFLELKKIVNRLIRPEDPLAILEAKKIIEIKESLHLIRESSEPLRIKSAGHSFAGFSMGRGLVVDVRSFNEVKVDVDQKRVIAGAGVTLNQLRLALDPSNAIFPTGTCPSVGLAGYILGGGHSGRSRYLGLGVDRVQAMDVLVASGEEIHVSPTQNSDLYWALLGGGGGNFGLVTQFYLDLIERPRELSFALDDKSGNFLETLVAWEKFLKSAPSTISPSLSISGRRGKIQRLRMHGYISGSFSQALDPKEVFQSFFPEPFLERFDQSKASLQWIGPYKEPKGYQSQARFRGTSFYADQPLGQPGFDKMLKAMSSTLSTSGLMIIDFNPMGGVILQPQRKNSYPHREAIYNLGLFLYVTKDTQILRDR